MSPAPQLELPPGGLHTPLGKGPWVSLEDIAVRPGTRLPGARGGSLGGGVLLGRADPLQSRTGTRWRFQLTWRLRRCSKEDKGRAGAHLDSSKQATQTAGGRRRPSEGWTHIPTRQLQGQVRCWEPRAQGSTNRATLTTVITPAGALVWALISCQCPRG